MTQGQWLTSPSLSFSLMKGGECPQPWVLSRKKGPCPRQQGVPVRVEGAGNHR